MPIKLERIDPSGMYDAKEAGKVLGIIPESVRNQFRKGILPYRKAFGKHVVLGVELLVALGYPMDKFSESVIGKSDPDKVSEIALKHVNLTKQQLLAKVAEIEEENLRLKAFLAVQ